MPRASGRFAVAALFLALVALGFFIKEDFGIAWDEPTLHEYGKVVLESVSEGSRRFDNLYNLRYYGPLVPVGLALIDKAVGGEPTRVYAWSHLANYLIFLGGVAAFHALCRRHFGGALWGFLGASFLVLSPRVFSHAFVNPKDVPFLSLFVVNVCLLSLYVETRRTRTLLALAAGTAALIAVRVLGIAFPGLVLLALVADTRRRGDPMGRGFVGPIALYAITAAALTVLLWPFLWGDPLANFLEALREATHLRGVPATVLYRGELIPTNALPWHYIPTWIAITTPPAYLALALVGLGVSAARWRQLQGRSLVLWSGLWLFGPLATVLVVRPVLYDEWRQLLFVYPALLVFAVEGARVLLVALPRARALLGAGLAAALLATLVTMVRLHPYQAVYFNAFAGGPSGAAFRYELDYWGLSYKEGLRFLLRSRGGPLRVNVCTLPGQYNAAWFDDGYRLKFRSLDDAEFAVCAPRQSKAPFLPDQETLSAVRRDGAEILLVKRLKPAP